MHWVQVFKEARSIRFPEAGITGGCESPTQVLGIELRSSGRAVHALNHEPSLQSPSQTLIGK